ncbi:MAG: hypothetical protein DIJKHBIC_02903 [Thermoanaerobaculia bacterium]|nr:hypothetical protein [Thermoanaerobaculia bacterium]
MGYRVETPSSNAGTFLYPITSTSGRVPVRPVSELRRGGLAARPALALVWTLVAAALTGPSAAAVSPGPLPANVVSAGSGSPAAVNTLRVYIAGESIERRNRWVEAPFLPSGLLNSRGGGDLRNDNEEYGWMVPMRDRLKLRAPDLDIQFVGSDVWADADDNPYTGTYPTSTAEPTSAISGTTIPSWLEQRREELERKTFCYDLAFASRGGNDFGNDNDTEYKAQLKELVLLLARGSSCRTDPIVVVTAHMPDDQRWGGPEDEYVALAKHRFMQRALDAVNELKVSNPSVRVRFADQYTPFLENKPTTAFPSETWSTNGIPDYLKIARHNDPYHPRRLSCIYAGELAADSLDLTELRGLFGGASCSVTITGPSSVCSGQSVTLSAGTEFASYLWSTGATTRAITVVPSTTTTYTVTATTTGGCQATSAPHTVTVNPLPSAVIEAPSNVPASSTGNTASVPDAGAGASYSWTISGGTITGNSSLRSVTFTAGETGSVTLNVNVTSSSGCQAAGTKSIPILASVAGPDLLLPVILDLTGEVGSHYTTELTFVSRVSSTLVISLSYVASSGGGSGTTEIELAPGQIRIIGNAIDFLRSAGLAIPADSTSKVGSLRATLPANRSASDVFLGARTSTPGGGGTYGLFYPALALDQSAVSSAWIFGLRQDSTMRSNLAVINRGDAGDSITLRITYYGNGGARLGDPVEVPLASGEWKQFGRPLEALGAATGYAKIEKISGNSRFVAYGVLNDAFTSDGSYIGMSF